MSAHDTHDAQVARVLIDARPRPRIEWTDYYAAVVDVLRIAIQHDITTITVHQIKRALAEGGYNCDLSTQSIYKILERPLALPILATKPTRFGLPTWEEMELKVARLKGEID
jgi:hypothetical protein